MTTTKQLSAVAKRVAKDFPHLGLKGTLLYGKPLDGVLRGIFLDRSEHPTTFYVWVFFQPLCVPARYVCFNLGSRLGEAWQLDSADLYARLKKAVADNLPLLEEIQSPHRAAIAGEALSLTKDAAAQRAIGYAYARAGKISKCIMALDRYLKLIAGDDREWVAAERGEVLNLRNLLLTNSDAAQKQLRSWEAETLTALGLT